MKPNAPGLLHIEDARDVVLPLFEMRRDGDKVDVDSRRYLGTAFFITKRGDALTAAHVLPLPESVPDGHIVVAAIRVNGETKYSTVRMALRWDQLDVALIRLNVERSEYLRTSAKKMAMGEEVTSFGVPDHQVWGKGLEMRFLSGWVSLTRPSSLDLTFAVPSGMSGSPIIWNGKVVAVATGAVTSESLLEQTEFVERIENGRERIERTRIVQMVQYGQACPLSEIEALDVPAFNGRKFMQMIREANENDADPGEAKIAP